MKRRNFLKGLMGLLGAVVAPSVISKVAPKFDDRFICFRELVGRQDLLDRGYKSGLELGSLTQEECRKIATAALKSARSVIHPNATTQKGSNYFSAMHEDRANDFLSEMDMRIRNSMHYGTSHPEIFRKAKNPVNSLSAAKEMMEKFGSVKLQNKKDKYHFIIYDDKIGAEKVYLNAKWKHKLKRHG